MYKNIFEIEMKECYLLW